MDTTTLAEAYSGLTLTNYSLIHAVIFLLFLLPLCAVTGVLVGRLQRSFRSSRGLEVDVTVGDTTLGAILALLGLILAFTFGNALSTFQGHKETLLQEANALGTAFLRTDYLPEPGSTELKQALLDYAKTRTFPEQPLAGDHRAVLAFIAETLNAQAKLWPLTVEASQREDVPAPVQTFMAGAMNDVLDSHLIRIQSFNTPVADASQSMTLMIAIIALLLLGGREGLAGHRINWRTFVFPAMLWVVMCTILDTQRGQEGFVQEDDGVMLATIRDMERTLAR